MNRREFTKLAGLSAVALTTSGSIHLHAKTNTFVGDCETTTDILGPFYRPDSPVRNNLVIDGMPGDLVELSGTVRHKDCKSPYANAKVELWHCSADEIYDNDSDEYRYRGTTYCDDQGNYKFTTQMPVPYDAGGGLIRPAHFHLMVSAENYQSLITQIYFTGDPNIKDDPYSADLKSRARVLTIGEANGIKKVQFDCNMNDQLKASYDALDRIIGMYKDQKSGKRREFFMKDDLLWMKNVVYGKKYDYIGNNEFEYGGLPTGMYEKLRFDLRPDGSVKLTMSAVREEGQKNTWTYTKI